MKNLLVCLFACCAVQSASAQKCCMPEGKSMAELAADKDFQASHMAPLPFLFTPGADSKMISFPTADGKKSSAFFVPAKTPSDKVLIVFHEWWGLNDYIKQEAEHWQQVLGDDVAIYAPDLYDGKVATTADQAGKYMGGLDAKRGAAIVSGLIREIGPDKKIYTIGWCMGGTWSFTASLLAGKQAAGCVMYYGFPEKDKEKVGKLKADVIYIYGTQDKYIKQEDITKFELAVKSSGHSFELHSFDAVHAFVNPSNPQHDKEKAQQAEAFVLDFLRPRMGK